jgi:hypothetical protein
MNDNQNFGFGKFVPGFDFLQNLAKGASQSMPQMPNLSNWVAPTLNLEELDKRIGELKAVHFWLDQNSKALGATIQALEVQKMTLATLKGMNFSMGEVANALKLKTADSMFGGVQKAGGAAVDTADTGQDAVPEAAPDAVRETGTKAKSTRKKSGKTGDAPAAGAGVVDPLQWWGALTQQFQQIAATAMKDAAPQTAGDTARNMGTAVAKEAPKTSVAAKTATGRKTAKKAARKAGR